MRHIPGGLGTSLGRQKVGLELHWIDGDFVPVELRGSTLFPPGCAMVNALDAYRAPPHKVVAMRKTGRDKLRVKYREVMRQRRALRIKFA